MNRGGGVDRKIGWFWVGEGQDAMRMALPSDFGGSRRPRPARNSRKPGGEWPGCRAIPAERAPPRQKPRRRRHGRGRQGFHRDRRSWLAAPAIADRLPVGAAGYPGKHFL